MVSAYDDTKRFRGAGAGEGRESFQTLEADGSAGEAATDVPAQEDELHTGPDATSANSFISSEAEKARRTSVLNNFRPGSTIYGTGFAGLYGEPKNPNPELVSQVGDHLIYRVPVPASTNVCKPGFSFASGLVQGWHTRGGAIAKCKVYNCFGGEVDMKDQCCNQGYDAEHKLFYCYDKSPLPQVCEQYSSK
ncbi:unnamed protein product [Amoebophrya sp. A120]|nr:unnamed protein product [Amoebophrya sp. A120]|eukprot:GSA120T00008253001.1